MKTTAQFINTKTIGAQANQEFTIAASSKAFRVLSDGLYSDKIATVVRELSTNAYDAHVEAGNEDTAFDVQFPNGIDPTFRIRDYGTGLSFDDAMHLYSTYFFSTKTDTNKQIGALGLGSKSPFGYTDGFTVTSYFGGEKMVFNCNIGEEGIPTISHIITVKSNEPIGLEVSFAVKQQNFQDFRNKAVKIWRHFDPAPNVSGVGSDEFSINTRDYVSEGKDWKLFANSEYGTKPIAVMGLIEYPIEYDKLVGITREERGQMYNMPIEVLFEIGELDISTNRESLSYDARTSRNLVDKVLGAFGELVAVMQADIAKCKTLWDARIKFCELQNSNYQIRSLINNKKVDITWKGITVKTTVSIYLYSNENYSDDLMISMFTAATTRQNEVVIRQNKFKATYDSNDRLSITAKNGIEIYIDDLGRGAPGRIKSYMAANGITKDVYLLQYGTKAELDYLLETVGMESFKLVTDLPEPVRVACKRGKGSPISTWILDHKRFVNLSSWNSKFSREFKKVTDFDYSEGGIYVTLDRVNPHNMPGFTYFDDFQNLVKTAHKLGILDDDVTLIGIAHAHEDKLLKLGGWNKLTTVVAASLNELATSPKFIEDMGIVNARRSVWVNLNNSLKTINSIGEDNLNLLLNYLNDNITAPVTHMKKALRDINTLKTYSLDNSVVKSDAVLAVMRTLDIEVSTKPMKVMFETVINIIIERAPITKILFEDINSVMEWNGGSGYDLIEEKVQLFVDVINNSK